MLRHYRDWQRFSLRHYPYWQRLDPQDVYYYYKATELCPEPERVYDSMLDYLHEHGTHLLMDRDGRNVFLYHGAGLLLFKTKTRSGAGKVVVRAAGLRKPQPLYRTLRELVLELAPRSQRPK